MKKIEFSSEDNSNKRIVLIARIGAVLLVVFFILEIWMANRLSTYGDRLERIKLAKDKLGLENQELEIQIAKAQTLLLAAEKSAQFGFDSIKNLIYLKPNDLALTGMIVSDGSRR